MSAAKAAEAGQRFLAKGNDAVAMGAIAAGCKYYFGYPITPQNEIPEYMSRELAKAGGVFVQAESELASINMVMGAVSTGVRAMTSSSSPGISLMQESLSYMAGQELPAMLVNMVRCGPGLGGIAASQGDYWQSVKGGGHGDYHLIVLAPDSVQELYDLTILAFELADRYRNPAMVLGDAILGQMKEPLTPRGETAAPPRKGWALTGAEGRQRRYIKSLYLDEGELEAHNLKLFHKYGEIAAHETRWEETDTADAELVVAAFGSAARIARTAVNEARKQGLKVGLFRPISLYPFPKKPLAALTARVRNVLTVELNMGQMVDDVRLSAAEGTRVDFYGRPGGAIPTPQDILREIGKRYPGRQGQKGPEGPGGNDLAGGAR